MAAGRQNLSRKRISNYSREAETLPYKSSYNQRTSGYRSNGYVDRNLDRDHRDYSKPVLPIGKEESVYENGSRLKKRRFSPIVWDGDEKLLKISKNDVNDDDDDVELHISSVESLVSNVSDGVGVSSSLADYKPASSPEEYDQEIEMEDGEYVEERKLSKSKWAFEDSPRKGVDVNNSSPESGEFKQDGFQGSEDASSLSAEDVKVASASIDYLSSDSDNDDYHRTGVGLDMMRCCRNVFEYERLNKISEGTYGVVYKARDKKTGEIVALKKVKMGKEREGFPVTSLREINILGSLQHPSIVEVKEVVTDDFDGVYMVMEYIDHELKGYTESMKHPFSQSEVKCLMIQLLEGLSYLHDNWVIHRDLKTSNLLLNKNGELKICDFGMSRQYGSPVKPYTPLVVTLWYRAPEILLGMKQYSTAIDMWSVGCIMAELLAKKPLFDGNRELEQIDKIFRTLGTPNDSIWPGYSKLPGVKSSFVKQASNNLRKRFPVANFTGSAVLTEMGFDLLNKLLTYDPKKRITAEEALNHGWFHEDPLPAQHVRIRK